MREEYIFLKILFYVSLDMSRTAVSNNSLRDLPVYGPVPSPKAEQQIQIMSDVPLRFPIRERPCFSLPTPTALIYRADR